ncbi:pyridoxal phosphate-dependent aminotransferase [Pimelobacter sp. 30-1]|uniref:pyridoxal phosphate-dependent aminotransferase n=1 Tax=Pimelobacter sp. 30-1 TaxID=2004991 RepID=UPI001C05408C|nr:aminotransferase class I/II-fold pyridoxal phosphate-dependent enzyme [Pimelobacter sp. 30-1]MBU2696977.1 hypothetical protein [Pimelobacter sp. 30-1]
MPQPFADRIDQLAMVVRDEQLGRPMLAAERRLFERAGRREGLVSLTHADTAVFPPPPTAGPRYADALAAGLNPFVDFLGDPEVRTALAPRLAAFLGAEVDPLTELALTAGTQNALFAILSVLVGPGDKVLIADPDYMTLEKTLRFLGADVVSVAARPAEGDGALEMSLADVEAGFRAGARLLLFSNPCNPTGTVYGPAFVAELARLAVEHDAYVLVDELYSRLVYDEGFPHLAAQPGMRERCVTTLGTSKTESMSGFRVGCVVGPAAVIAVLPEVLEVTALRASSYAQRTLLDWLGPDAAFIDERVAILRELRDLTVKRLREVPGLEVAEPGGTAYVFPRLSGHGLDDFAVAEALVEDAGVLVYPGLCFGPSGEGGFRLCFGQDPEALPGILDRTVAALTRLTSGGAR